MTGEQSDKWDELRARAVIDSTPDRSAVVDLLRGDKLLARASAEEALEFGIAVCEEARRAIFDDSDLPVVPLEDEPAEVQP